MQKRYISLMTLLSVLFLVTSCGHYATGNTAEDALFNYLQKMEIPVTPALDGVTIVAHRNFADKTIFLYSKPQPRYNKALFFVVVQKSADQWFVEQTGYAGGSSFTNPNPYIAFSWDMFVHHMLVYGKRIDPRVARVSVTFENRQTISDQTIDEYFMIQIEPLLNVCTVQIYDSTDTLLLRPNVAGDPVDNTFICPTINDLIVPSPQN